MRKVSVLMPYRDQDDGGYRRMAFEAVHAQWEKYLSTDDEIIVQDDEHSLAFRRGTVRNEAFMKSSGDVIVIADADTLFDPAAVDAALAALDAGNMQWTLPFLAYYNADRAWTDKFFAKQVSLLMREPQPTYEHELFTSPGGVTVLTRAAFLTVKGYDERFVGWGYEDNAFVKSLEVLCGPLQRVAAKVVHLWHPAPEAVRFSQPHIEENKALYERYEAAVTPEMMRALIEERATT